MSTSPSLSSWSAGAPSRRLGRIFECNLVLILAAVLSIAAPAFAAERALETLLPTSCASGWTMDGKVATYTPENLYKYINGEAELYVPYGFRKAAAVMYIKPGSKDVGIVANIFEMGSLLDAFGIYGNFRSPALEQIKVGADGFLDESQLMFYQGRYFVQIEASGTLTEARSLFRSCADAISRNLPDEKEKPRELEFLKVTGIAPLTEKYYAAGLLGHSFFGKGFTAEVMVGDTQAKSLLIPGGSDEAAARVLSDYEKYLKKSGATPQLSSDKRGVTIHVTDPLYKGAVLRQSGAYVVGVVGLKEPHQGDAIVEQMLRHLPTR